jgi:hypothetical protein
VGGFLIRPVAEQHDSLRFAFRSFLEFEDSMMIDGDKNFEIHGSSQARFPPRNKVHK